MDTSASDRHVGSSDYQNKKEEEYVYQAKPIASEKLLVATGPLDVKEQSRAYDPAQAHLQARQKVNKNDFKTHNELSPHFKPDAQSGMDGVMRVLKVTGDTSFLDEENTEYAQVQNSVTKPSQTVSEVKETQAAKSSGGGFMQKLGSLFSDNAQSATVQTKTKNDHRPLTEVAVVSQGGADVVIPSRKPSYRKTTIQLSSDTQVSQVRYKIQDGVVVLPPYTPIRKIRAKQAVTFPQDVDQQKNTEGSAGGFVHNIANLIKPDRGEKETGGVVSKGDVGHVETKTIKIGDIILPVPGTKPMVSKEYTKRPSQPSPPRLIIEKGQEADGTVTVEKLRAGAHSNKIRLVIEVSEPTKYKATVDDIRNVLLVKLDKAHWNIAPQASFSNNKLLGTYIAKPSSGGATLLEVRLKKPTKIISSTVLDPLKGSGHRIIIDLEL